MTNTNTEWEKRFDDDYELGGGFRDLQIMLRGRKGIEKGFAAHIRLIKDFIRTEKEKSYQEGDKAGFERGVAAEREKNNRVLYALALMWNQYCGERGHLFMMAGEAALEELQRAGLLGDNHEEIDYKKIDALLTPTNTV